jgi:hypothetical protein
LGVDIFSRSYWPASIQHHTDADDTQALSEPGTLLLSMHRERLLRYLPNSGNIAEIGVARAKFSRRIRATCKPRLLVLVDPWIEQDESVYTRDTNNVAMAEQERRYRRVSARFSRTSSSRECRVIRKFSLDAAREFEDGTFDWVYIDGNHAYEPCLSDLKAWAPKVKADGFICGHDFANHAAARAANFGVIDAVRQFTNETQTLLAAITVEHFPTFVIAKNPAGENLQRLRSLIFSYERHVVQLADWSRANLMHARLRNPSLPRSAYLSFDFLTTRAT